VKLHGNAKLTPVQRRLLVSRVLDEHWTYADVAPGLQSAFQSPLSRWRHLR
jgi:hypothetical protein